MTKNLAVAGRGERLLPDGTTDVWAHDRHAYVGTFMLRAGPVRATARTGWAAAEGHAGDDAREPTSATGEPERAGRRSTTPRGELQVEADGAVAISQLCGRAFRDLASSRPRTCAKRTGADAYRV